MEPDYIELPFDYQTIVGEIATHEAAHFVFGILGQSIIPDFTPVTGIQLCPEDLKGEISGFQSPLNSAESHVIKTWYLEDERRYYAKILTSLAGFVSYKALVNNTDYFILKTPSVWRNLETVTYHKLESRAIFSTREDGLGGIPDFNGVQSRLKWKGEAAIQNKIEIIRHFVNDIQEIMGTTEINGAIRFVRDYLLGNSNKIIVGSELDSLKGEVNQMVEKMSIESYIKSYSNLI
jgi:hypothetical protein